MKKSQVRSILVNQTKRRNIIFTYFLIIGIIFSLLLLFLILYFNSNKKEYITYKEESSIDYQVYYKDNEFFMNNYLASNKQYIASLINEIKANFNYKFVTESEDIDYQYKYRIDANVKVFDKDNKNILYESNEKIINEKTLYVNNNSFIIDEDISINYDKYNDLITKFIKIYDLNNSLSYLDINMYVYVSSACEDYNDDEIEERIITLSIPLTKDTISIDLVDNLSNGSNKIMKCSNNTLISYILLSIIIILLIMEIITIIFMVRYEHKTRTVESIYEKKMKKILNNYGSCIQVLKNDFDFSTYQLLKMDTFVDLLDISEKLRQPILLKENIDKTGAYFVIPSSTNILYVYRLNVDDIRDSINKM